MALQMFACTATQTCVVNISRPVGHRRENRPIGDESVLKVDRLRAESREYRTLSSFRPVLFLLFFFISSMERHRSRVIVCRSRLADSIDRSIARIDRRASGVWILCSLFLNLFFFCFWKIRTFPRAEWQGHSDTPGILV